MQSCIRCVVAVVVTASCSSAALATTVYVDDNAPAGGDGASWSTAYRTVQDALYDAVSPGSGIDEIRVAQGVYTPDRSDHGHVTPGDRDAGFQLIDGVALLGGYGGITNPDPDERDPDQFVTTLSGDLAGNDGPDFAGYNDNAKSIVRGTNIGSAAVIDGFTISGGNAGGGNGGGMRLANADPQVLRCRFEFNTAGKGGGISNRIGSNPTIQHCTFRGNRATAIDGAGGGISYFGTSSATVTDCQFLSNTAPNGYGGGFRFQDGQTCVLKRCTFNGNFAELGGGAMLGEPASVPLQFIRIEDSRFIDNEAFGFGGGAVFHSASSVCKRTDFIKNTASAYASIAAIAQGLPQSAYLNCVFAENTATLGAAILEVGNLFMANCVVANNSASLQCGGICLLEPSSIINCTIIGNEGPGIDVLSVGASGINIKNCIVRGNTDSQIKGSPSNYTVSFCNVQGGWPGTGNIDADPLFVQPGTRNYRLSTGSPCLNAGSTGALPPDTYDLDEDGNTIEALPIDLAGDPRVQSGAVDIGAYEGAFDMLPPAALNDDFDAGEPAILSVGGGLFFGDNVIVVALNLSGQDNAMIQVTDLRDGGRLGADQPMLRIDTDVPAGQLKITATAPVTLADLLGHDPLDVAMTVLNPDTGNWLLAPALNAQNSPDYDEPIGDRFAVTGTAPSVPSSHLGDYGVFWNPDAQRGFIWANTDRPGDYSIRLQMCPGDGAPYGGDHVLDIFDLYGVLDHWNEDHRWFDTDDNQFIDVHDVIHMLEHWGTCE